MQKESGMINEAADEYDPKLTDLKSKLQRLESKYALPSSWSEIRKITYPKPLVVVT